MITLARPVPPAAVLSAFDDLLVPAPDVWEWARAAFVEDGAPLYNADHQHLVSARIGVLWTNVEHVRQMRRVIGTAEIPQVMGGAWKRARAEQQIREWFGGPVDFLITLSAPDLVEEDDATFCAVLEHELYHCAQAHDAFGAPRFHRDGSPAWAIRGHDVEEFIGVTRRYGPGAASTGTAALVRAANNGPTVAAASIAGACGSCGRGILP